ncbi:UbiA family prenyltransferase [bacterium]|jgi:4-hydroxybenzoate polyprenyltransferase|nr:UbiA family prenyltransferase [bacterium]
MVTTKNFLQYLKERFPLQQFALLTIIFALVSTLSVQTYLGQIDYASIVYSCLALFLFLFRLRLFDEFKDYKHDKEYYPDRPIPRGLMKLTDLKKIILVVLFLEVIISFTYYPGSTLIFVIAVLYSLLMFKEFFISDWLKEHFTTYIVSHEILLFPLFFYIFSLSGFEINNFYTPHFWWLFLFLGGQLFLLEVTRKFRSEDTEIASRDTYTAQYGIYGASVLVFLLSIAIIFSFIKLGVTQNYIFYILALWLILITTVGLFIKKPRATKAKIVFGASILFSMGSDILLIIHLLLNHG